MLTLGGACSVRGAVAALDRKAATVPPICAAAPLGSAIRARSPDRSAGALHGRRLATVTRAACRSLAPPALGRHVLGVHL